MAASVNGDEKRPSSSADHSSNDEKRDVKIDIPATVANSKDKKSKDTTTLKPVSFFALFRFSTRLEIFLDIIGIICAVLAGAAQVCVMHEAHLLLLRV